jgi:RNA polymerase sigma factor (sigma-70 family)
MTSPNELARPEPHWNHDGYNTQNEVVAQIPALRAFARTFCHRPEDADDLVQETLLKALSNLDRYEPNTKLKSWLFTIMRNTFLTRIVRSNREDIGITPQQSAQMVTPPTQEERVRLTQIQQALFRLPAHHREILVLIVVLGEPYEVAAQICGCAIGTVKSRLNRARRQLYRELGEEDDQGLDGSPERETLPRGRPRTSIRQSASARRDMP